MSNRVMSPGEVCLRLWGESHLSPQQNRVWRHLLANEECEIAKLFVAARPGVTHSRYPLLTQQRTVGMVTSKINKKLKGHYEYIIRPGDSRFSYRLEPSAR